MTQMKKNNEFKPVVIEARVFNLSPDKPNSNGRIYSKDILEKMAEKINKGEVFFHSHLPDDGMPLGSTTIGSVSNAEVKEDGLWVKVTQLDTPMNHVMEMYSEWPETPCPYPIAPMSIGDVDGDMRVTEANLMALYVGPANDPAFKPENK